MANCCSCPHGVNKHTSGKTCIFASLSLSLFQGHTVVATSKTFLAARTVPTSSSFPTPGVSKELQSWHPARTRINHGTYQRPEKPESSNPLAPKLKHLSLSAHRPSAALSSGGQARSLSWPGLLPYKARIHPNGGPQKQKYPAFGTSPGPMQKAYGDQSAPQALGLTSCNSWSCFPRLCVRGTQWLIENARRFSPGRSALGVGKTI